MVIDLHTHTLLSDGNLLISELTRRAEIRGYRVIGITDHVDFSNLKRVITETTEVCSKINRPKKIIAIPGIEITHVPPDLMPEIISQARKMGSKLIMVHGETPVEPVQPGTNRQAILSGTHILAHPGFISDEDLLLAKEKGIYLELSYRAGHCLTNGYVALKAKEYGIPLLVNSDAHSPEDLLTPQKWKEVALGAGLSEQDWIKIKQNSIQFVRELGYSLEEEK